MKQKPIPTVFSLIEAHGIEAILAGINSALTHQIINCHLPKRRHQLELIRLAVTQAYNLELFFTDNP